VLVEKQRMSCK